MSFSGKLISTYAHGSVQKRELKFWCMTYLASGEDGGGKRAIYQSRRWTFISNVTSWSNTVHFRYLAFERSREIAPHRVLFSYSFSLLSWLTNVIYSSSCGILFCFPKHLQPFSASGHIMISVNVTFILVFTRKKASWQKLSPTNLSSKTARQNLFSSCSFGYLLVWVFWRWSSCEPGETRGYTETKLLRITYWCIWDWYRLSSFRRSSIIVTFKQSKVNIYWYDHSVYYI